MWEKMEKNRRIYVSRRSCRPACVYSKCTRRERYCILVASFLQKYGGFKCCFEWQYTFRFIPLTYTGYSLCIARSLYYSGARRRNIVFVWKRSSWHWNIVNVPIYEFLYPLSFHLYASELHCNSLALILKYRQFLKLRSTCNAFFRDKFKY